MPKFYSIPVAESQDFSTEALSAFLDAARGQVLSPRVMESGEIISRTSGAGFFGSQNRGAGPAPKSDSQRPPEGTLLQGQ